MARPSTKYAGLTHEEILALADKWARIADKAKREARRYPKSSRTHLHYLAIQRRAESHADHYRQLSKG